MKKLKLIIFIFFISQFSIAQSHDIKFKHLTIEDGLSLSSVYCVLQDSQGFMWFATEDGLNRYDGYDFTIFRPNVNNPNSLSEKWINNIFEDKNKNLWIVTYNGLNKYIPENEFFVNYQHSTSDNNSISNNYVTVFFEDNKGTIWLGTKNGLNKYIPEEDNFLSFQKKDVNTSISDNYITAIAQDKHNNLWIGTQNGLNKFNNETGEFINFSYNTDDGNSLINNNIQAVYTDDDGTIWIGTENGLSKYNTSNNNFTNFTHKPTNTNSISNNNIKSIFKDSKNNFWIGTENGFDLLNTKTNNFRNIIRETQTTSNSLVQLNRPIFEDKTHNIWLGSFASGLFKYNYSTNKVYQYTNNPLKPNSISENAVNSIIQDSYGVLWFGTFGAGLSKYDPSSNKFELFISDPNNSNSLSENFVWSIFEDSDGEVWVGTNSQGVNRYNPKNGNFTHYLNNPQDNNSLSNNTVREIYQDSKGLLWFGTDGGGVDCFNKKTSKFIHYTSDLNDTTTISSNSVRVVYEDSKNNLWFGTTNGLSLFDRAKKTFKSYVYDENNSNSISNNLIYSCIFEDHNGIIWFGTYGGGLNKFNTETQQFKHYINEQNNYNSIIDNHVFSIREDEQNNLWIATNAGLEKFNPGTDNFVHFTTNDGLPNNTIYGILPEKDKSIYWLSTNYGLSKFDYKQNTFVNFTDDDGLQSIEFNGGAFHAGRSGKMFVAGVNGLNIFHPDSIKYNTIPPDVLITKFNIFAKKVNIFNSNTLNENATNDVIIVDNEYFTYKSIINTEEIRINYSEKVFSFEFAGLHYSNPKQNKYSYRLRNFETDWNMVENRHFVSYTNLSPGEYYFEIKSSNSDGIWSKEIKTLKIIIVPPVWQTWWFRIIAGLIIVVSIILFIKLRERNLTRQKRILSQEVKKRTAEVVEQHDKILTQNEQITDSINYAKNIQNAILPTKTFIDTIIPNHFIFFKPKDIISGDFYYLKKINNTIILVAADCTGHGVPGAFVSMLGIALLNEIVRKEDVTTASQVLEDLRTQVKTSLQQTGKENDTRDGMDISLAIIDIETKIMQYSGANNPLFLIRDKGSKTIFNFIDEKNIRNTIPDFEQLKIFDINTSKTDKHLYEIKADKQPIGIYFKERPFTNYKINIEKDDVFYFFSDGYADQFGGNDIKTRKFNTKRFKQLLLAISEKPMQEQKQILTTTLDKWQGENNQIDDTLIVGIKIT